MRIKPKKEHKELLIYIIIFCLKKKTTRLNTLTFLFRKDLFLRLAPRFSSSKMLLIIGFCSVLLFVFEVELSQAAFEWQQVERAQPKVGVLSESREDIFAR
jgi:hypothetical protein